MPGTRKLGKATDARMAMLRQQVTDLLDRGRMETTYTRAKDGTYIFEASTLLNDFYKITDTDDHTFEEVEGDAELDREYISDPDARVAFYKRAASLENLKEMRSFLSDTEDVYGKAPESAKLLAKIGLAKNLAKRLGVKKVVSTKNGAGLEFKDSAVYKNTAVLDATLPCIPMLPMYSG